MYFYSFTNWSLTLSRRTRATSSVSQRALELRAKKRILLMAASSSSAAAAALSPAISLHLLRPLPCRAVLLSRQRRPFPSPRAGCLAAVRAQRRWLRSPEIGRWRRRGGYACLSFNSGNKPPPPSSENSDEWPILRRWDVPWEWQTVVLTMVGCGVRQLCSDRIG